MSKEYTAQKMREMATEAEVIEVADQFFGRDMDTIAAMLRQAAEIRERIDDLLLTFHSCPDERDRLNYILHGASERNTK